MEEQKLLTEAHRRGLRYLEGIEARPVFPSPEAIAALSAFDEPLPQAGMPAESTLSMLDELGSPATTASNGPGYFGFVVGGTLPAASAAEHLLTTWDQCASSFLNSPVADYVERIAGKWVLEALDLPRQSAVGFGTSATACTLAALSAARRELLARQGWDIDNDGLQGAPDITVVVSELVHITVKKALRILGFGLSRLRIAPVDPFGRIDVAQLPQLDNRTLLCLQAGEVNTGECDPFAEIIPLAHKAGAWVHVDAAFGLWARASAQASLTEGIDLADSWTTDAHKWLNTPYDCAMVICREPQLLAGAMNSDAVYTTASADAQKNLTLEFSRRPRGIPVWAALRVLGRDGLQTMIDQHCAMARRISEGLTTQGFEVLNRVVLNQVLFRCATEEETATLLAAAQASGRIWFGSTRWQGRLALRISVSSWRTRQVHVDMLLETLKSLCVK
ncbi:aminotransferase class V-fold PLP-dependent enzyme [Yokenella regensburgei]|uniref:pyridoxal phosphate-dependent decarboxylase family protein n=1 Tax=Yokenella regensburgei TaxID=158877 RepID=UPI003F168CA2